MLVVSVCPSAHLSIYALQIDHVLVICVFISNTQIKIAPSVDKGRILIRILNRKPWLSR